MQPFIRLADLSSPAAAIAGQRGKRGKKPAHLDREILVQALRRLEVAQVCPIPELRRGGETSSDRVDHVSVASCRLHREPYTRTRLGPPDFLVARYGESLLRKGVCVVACACLDAADATCKSIVVAACLVCPRETDVTSFHAWLLHCQGWRGRGRVWQSKAQQHGQRGEGWGES